ncbi:hypothetical protein MNBD_GAMMA12-3013 [hydrothermal vent metagenome]|uniref:Pentapeptide repeat family protein n=1 Tax=hydrothermal vent metagenome TaxID=652676 RepID=A0A3B0XUQ9_9ZZZZ
MNSENQKLKPVRNKKSTHQNWFIRAKGKVQGPFPKGMIQSFVLSGRFKLGDEVSFDKDAWSKLKEHRELIPKELLNVKTEDDKERLRMAIRRENDRLHDQRTEQCHHENEKKGKRGSGHTNEVGSADTATAGAKYKRKKNSTIQSIVFVMFLSALAVVVFYIYSVGSKSVISITNCSAPAAPQVNWTHCKLEGFKAISKDLSGGSFSNVKFKGADLHGSTFKNSNFQYADLTLANFSYADLSQTKFTGAVLRGADLTNTDLRGSDLSYTNLLNAKLGGARLKGARFDSAIWVDGRKCKTNSIGYCR